MVPLALSVEKKKSFVTRDRTIVAKDQEMATEMAEIAQSRGFG